MVDRALQTLPFVLGERRTDDPKSRLINSLGDGEVSILALERVQTAHELGGIDSPKRLNVLEYFVVFVGELDMVLDDIVPPATTRLLFFKSHLAGGRTICRSRGEGHDGSAVCTRTRLARGRCSPGRVLRTMRPRRRG